MSIPAKRRPPPSPAWQIARLYPLQGEWDDGDYLALDTNHLVEFTDGRVEVLKMPTMSHQLMVIYLCNLLAAFATAGKLGTAVIAPLRVKLRTRKYREPNVVFMLAEHANRMGQNFWTGDDLVMEVVSDDVKSRARDLVRKRTDYAKAGIPEYWIIDPAERRITVLKLAGARYVVHTERAGKGLASSSLLGGFEVDVEAVWAAGRL